MDVFGPGWANHVQRLEDAFSNLRDDDVTVLCGDTSWGIDLSQSLADFRFIDRLPGKKLLVKGNHDYWWNTAAKMRRFFQDNGLTTIDILHNNCHFYGDWALCGTRGWFYEEDQQAHNEKVFNREVIRLEASLKAGGGPAHPGLPPLPAPLRGLPLPGDPRQAGGVRRGALLLRPSPRRHPPPGHRGDGRNGGIPPGVRGLSAVCPEKNL